MASFSPSEKCYATDIYPEQERAMEKQFAASEVRRLSNRIPRSNDEIADAQEALRAFADLLEAREKAVPVAELAALKARIAEAPTAAARIVNDGRGGITRTYVCHESQSCIVLPSLDGYRGRLVVEE